MPDAADDVVPRPLAGIRVLALEQMQAVPFATQLLARLGAEVIKVEHPVRGDLGRGARPAVTDPQGRSAGATFLRNNLGKRSIGIDIKTPRGRELVLALAARCDVFAENFKSGALERMGLGYEAVCAVRPDVVYLSISGFGNTTDSPYRSWPAYAAIAEAMSGLYEWKRTGDNPPTTTPAGALGDIGSALFGVIGVLAALRCRDRSGQPQRVDVAMFDAMVAFADVVVNYWSLGERAPPEEGPGIILDGFRADDGWFIVQVGREHEFARLARTIGHPEWIDDPRFADRAQWRPQFDVIRAAVESWAKGRSTVEACHTMAAAGIAAGPVFSAAQVIADPHLAQREMIVEVPRDDGVDEPYVVPGNPVKLSGMPTAEEVRPPWLGEHTDEILTGELDLQHDEVSRLRDDGVVG